MYQGNSIPWYSCHAKMRRVRAVKIELAERWDKQAPWIRKTMVQSSPSSQRSVREPDRSHEPDPAAAQPSRSAKVDVTALSIRLYNPSEAIPSTLNDHTEWNENNVW
jgi:hypothetical protein